MRTVICTIIESRDKRLDITTNNRYHYYLVAKAELISMEKTYSQEKLEYVFAEEFASIQKILKYLETYSSKEIYISVDNTGNYWYTTQYKLKSNVANNIKEHLEKLQNITFLQ